VLTLNKIWIYPIKSAGKVELKTAIAEPRGLKNDRRWMLIDAKGRFLSQREYPLLALVQVEFRNGSLILKAPNQQAFECNGQPEDAPGTLVQVWKDTLTAQLVSPEADLWFSKYLGMGCRLVRMRATDERLVESRAGVEPGTMVSFADGYPFLLIGEGSLKDLNNRLDHPVTMAHFRPNLVISGTTPFQEDQWSRIAIGEATFDVVKPCKRCVMTTINPETGVKAGHGDPLKTLAGYRKHDGGVIFGQNLVLRQGGRVEVGQEVKVIH